MWFAASSTDTPVALSPDLTTWSRRLGSGATCRAPPLVLDHFSAVVSGGRLYLVGGRDTSYHEPGDFTAFFKTAIRKVDVYDFQSGQWTTMPSRLPVATAVLSAWTVRFTISAAKPRRSWRIPKLKPSTWPLANGG